MRKSNRIISAVMAAVFCIAGVQDIGDPGTDILAAGAPAVWDGSESDDWYYESDDTVYHLSTAEDLAGFAKMVNNGTNFSGKTVVLDNDIYLNDVSDFDNWGTKAPANQAAMIGRYFFSTTGHYYNFDGIFDGGGNTIHGVYLKDDSYSKRWGTALFRITGSNSVIRNLNIADSYIRGTDAAGVSSFSSGTIKNCSFSGVVSSDGNAAGINCESNGTTYVYNCTNYGTISGVEASGIKTVMRKNDVVSGCRNYGAVNGNFAAGIVISSADNEITVKNSINYGDITARSDAGGIITNALNDITGCFNYGNVSSNGLAGGIAASANASNSSAFSITGCGNYGTVSTTEYGGGITAKLLNCTVSDCFNRGEVIAENKEYYDSVVGKNYYPTETAGIAARVSTGAVIKNCYNRAPITGGYAGGLASYIYAVDMSDSYSTGAVTSTYTDAGKNALYCWIPDNHGTIKISNCHYPDTLYNESFSETKGISVQTDEFMKAPEFAELLGDHFAYSEGDYPILGFESELEPYPPVVPVTTTTAITTVNTTTTAVTSTAKAPVTTTSNVKTTTATKSTAPVTTTTTSTTVPAATVRGDVNADSEFNIADAVLMQKWLLAVPGTELKNWEAGDMNGDGKLDLFDLIIMKTELV